MELKIKKKILVFLDEAGDHSLTKIDHDFPIFAIVGVVFNPENYPDVVFRFNRLKLNYFVHEGIIIHSREIASREGDFVFLNNKQNREHFLSEISEQVGLTKMQIAASIIKKIDLKNKYKDPFSPYDLAFNFIFVLQDYSLLQ